LKNNRIRGEIAQSQAHKTHKYVNNAWSEISNSPPALLFIPLPPRHNFKSIVPFKWKFAKVDGF